MILCGDAFEMLATIPPNSIQCCVTSPPYWALRDYGAEGQLGMEPTPQAYIGNMRLVFEQVRRVLKKDGTLWVNIGDCYASAGGTGYQGMHGDRATRSRTQRNLKRNAKAYGMKPKDLVGIPWALAFALREDGWYLRRDIIWHKPNPMPENVKDRPTTTHEYIFLFAKSEKYYYDHKAIMEPVTGGAHSRGNGVNPKAAAEKDGPFRSRQNASFSGAINALVERRNKRSVWTIKPSAYKGAHSATFPPGLAEPCILAGSRPGDTVLDPFLGSGTTAMVAHRHGRKYIGIEIHPANVEMAERRIAKGK